MLYELSQEGMSAIPTTRLPLQAVPESRLRQVLRDQIEVVAPDCLVLEEEFRRWSEGRRSIDLLALDRDANLVVIELKRDDCTHMELQALRYAAMVRSMTFEQAEEVHADYLARRNRSGDSRRILLDHLGWSEPDEPSFARNVRIVLVSAEFSTELTTTVLWLREHGIDVRCVRFQPYLLNERLLLDVDQVIPLPEVADYQVGVSVARPEPPPPRRSQRDYSRLVLEYPDGDSSTPLAKRRAMLEAVRRLMAQGVTPEAIHQAIEPVDGRRFDRVWLSLPGQLDPESFEEVASHLPDRGFEGRRWFLESLFQHCGSTLAFTSQWGDTTTDVLGCLASAFPGVLRGYQVQPA